MRIVMNAKPLGVVVAWILGAILAVLLATTAWGQSGTVPNVVGLQQSQAESTITQSGFAVGTVTFQTSFVVPAGQVMDQRPLSGTAAPLGSLINITVSAGTVASIVPNIIGLSRTEAVSSLTSAGLTVGTVTAEVNTSFVPDTVLNQSPVAGTSVAPGTAVNFVVSRTAGTVLVPNVVGLQEATARTTLTSVGLTVGTVTRVTDATAPEGEVTGQSPGAGSNATLGTAVNLTVSAGAGVVLVPDVVGLTSAAAQTAIVGLGLTLGTVTQRASSTIPAGVVLSQSPVAGTAVQLGTAVNLVVSSGSGQTPVPDVIGLGLVAAEQAILNVGLRVGTITEQTNPAVPAGTVITQRPLPGTLVAAGSAVNLTVSAGTGLTIVPNVIGLTLAAAESAILDAELLVGTVTTSPSAGPPNIVLLQSPTGGVSAPLRTRVDLVISAPLATVSVPTVVGLQEATARTAITQVGLVVGTITRLPSTTVPTGNVISQIPTGGTLVAAGSAVNLVISTGATQTVVPDVRGLTQAAAVTAITNAGLTVGTITQQASTTVPAGNVISQSPQAGVTVAVGAVVNLVVSTGSTAGTVPTVVGLTQAEAQTAITAAGFVVGTITQQISTTVPAGNVISQNPAGGTVAAAGTAVNLVVSIGTGTLVSVPNVVGLQRTAAQTTITNAGLVVGTVDTQFTTTVPAGQVLSQSPAAGTMVSLRTPVNLVVSTRTQMVLVPNVVGLTLAQATTALTGSGLVVGNVIEQPSTTVPAGSVISQSPAANTQVASGTHVTLIVSTGQATVTVPDLVGLTLAQAQRAISLSVFVLGGVTAEASTAPVNEVIRQVPAAGQSAVPGTAINLTISAGVSPVTVPNVVGLTRAAAVRTITDAGLTVGLVTLRPNPQVAADTVLEQNPAAGSVAAAGSAVNIVVSQGIVLTEVPTVTGLMLEAATAALTGAGLVVGNVTQQQSAQAAGIVLSQFPVAGTTVDAGSAVDLVVSQGPGVVPQPLNFTASAGTYEDFVRLTWDPVEGANSYQVFRASTADVAQAEALATVAETTYDDTTTDPPEVISGGGCFNQDGEDVVIYDTRYYWVLASTDEGNSALVGPAAGFRGLAAPSSGPAGMAAVVLAAMVGLGVMVVRRRDMTRPRRSWRLRRKGR